MLLNARAIRAKLERIDTIPTISPVLTKILKLTSDPNSSTASVSQLITSDPALTAKILRAINAAVYGFNKRISSVNQAIVLLGLDVVKTMLLAVSISHIMEKIVPGLWKHSLGCSLTSKMLAEKNGRVDSQGAAVAGLLHDIGKAALSAQFSKDYQRILDLVATNQMHLVEAERQVFDGVDHGAAGAIFAEACNFPGFVVEAIRYHHKPFLAKGEPLYAATTHMADIFVKGHNIGFSGDPLVPLLHPAACTHLNFSEDEIKEVYAKMDDVAAEVERFFDNEET